MDIGVDISAQLFPNPFTMLFTLLVTSVLLFFVRKYLFEPARLMLAQRADYVQSQLTDADSLNEKAQANLAKSKEEIDYAAKLSNEIIDNAKKEAIDVKDEIVRGANVKAEDIYKKAHERIKKEEIELRKDLHSEIINVALAASEKLMVSKELEKQDSLSIEKFIEELDRESSK